MQLICFFAVSVQKKVQQTDPVYSGNFAFSEAPSAPLPFHRYLYMISIADGLADCKQKNKGTDTMPMPLCNSNLYQKCLKRLLLYFRTNLWRSSVILFVLFIQLFSYMTSKSNRSCIVRQQISYVLHIAFLLVKEIADTYSLYDLIFIGSAVNRIFFQSSTQVTNDKVCGVSQVFLQGESGTRNKMPALASASYPQRLIWYACKALLFKNVRM